MQREKRLQQKRKDLQLEGSRHVDGTSTPVSQNGEKPLTPRTRMRMGDVVRIKSLSEKLDELVEKNLLIVRAGSNGRRYSFRNNMIRKGAYNMLIGRQRNPLHTAIAEFIEHRTMMQVAKFRRAGKIKTARIASGQSAEDDFLARRTSGEGIDLGSASILTSLIRQYRLLAQHLRHAGSLERSLEQGLRAINLASNMHIDESVIAIACEALDTLDVLKDVHEHEELSFEMFITHLRVNYSIIRSALRLNHYYISTAYLRMAIRSIISNTQFYNDGTFVKFLDPTIHKGFDINHSKPHSTRTTGRPGTEKAQPRWLSQSFGSLAPTGNSAARKTGKSPRRQSSPSRPRGVSDASSSMWQQPSTLGPPPAPSSSLSSSSTASSDPKEKLSHNDVLRLLVSLSNSFNEVLRSVGANAGMSPEATKSSLGATPTQRQQFRPTKDLFPERERKWQTIVLRLIVTAAKVSWDFNHWQTATLCAVSALHVLLLLCVDLKSVELCAEQATRLFDLLQFVAHYESNLALSNVVVQIVERLELGFRCSPFALCEHALNQATMDMMLGKMTGTILTLANMVQASLSAAEHTTARDQATKRFHVELERSSTATAKASSKNFAHASLKRFGDSGSLGSGSHSFASSPLQHNDSLESHWNITLDSHITLWVNAKTVCGDAALLSGDLRFAADQFHGVFRVASRQGCASAALSSALRISFLHFLTHNRSMSQKGFERICRMVPNLGDMFKLHDHHIESAWNVFTDFGQTAGKLNGYRFVGGVGEANVGKDEKDSGQKTNNMAGRASSTAPAVARSTNVEPRVEGVDDSVDGWATAEKVFLAENEHQVTIAELKNLLAFACHSLVSARAHNIFGRYSMRRQLLETLQHKFSLGVITEEEARHMAAAAGLEVSIGQIFEPLPAPDMATWNSNEKQVQMRPISPQKLTLASLTRTNSSSPEAKRTARLRTAQSTPDVLRSVTAGNDPRVGILQQFRPRKVDSRAALDRLFSSKSLLNVLGMFASDTADMNPRQIFGFAWILDTSISLLENLSLRRMGAAIVAAHTVKSPGGCECYVCQEARAELSSSGPKTKLQLMQESAARANAARDARNAAKKARTAKSKGVNTVVALLRDETHYSLLRKAYERDGHSNVPIDCNLSDKFHADEPALKAAIEPVFAAFGQFHRKYPFGRCPYKYFYARYFLVIGDLPGAKKRFKEAAAYRSKESIFWASKASFHFQAIKAALAQRSNVSPVLAIGASTSSIPSGLDTCIPAGPTELEDAFTRITSMRLPGVD
eukprot:INCI14755.1.p1 GENE.INCI14755.1~~INCI14755.1.p1  ORF type:complete len:1450 (+),score=264.23 INCI14755.1:523-4350(+)